MAKFAVRAVLQKIMSEAPPGDANLVYHLSRAIDGAAETMTVELEEIKPEPAAMSNPIDATDSAVAVAMELGVDLREIAGSGAAGRITVADVRASAEGGDG